MESDRATATKFNNVTSLGVSYSWENGSHGNPCTGLLGGKAKSTGKWIKRTKEVSLDVRNLDLLNSGNGAVVEGMAASQSKYTNTERTKVYANGNYMGEGRLSDYSISEGSQSNDVTTSLSYSMPDGGPDDTPSIDGDDDPVSWTSSITVSRDVKEKKYSIVQNASASFGNEFDLITNDSRYVDNPQYASAVGRLAEAEKWANSLIFTDQVDYNDYIDLSAYKTAAGWDLKLLAKGNSGVKSSSSFTRDYINGNYSSTRTTSLLYTGENLNSSAAGGYTVKYSIGVQSAKGGPNNTQCTKATLKGTVNGVAGASVAGTAADVATSGYNVWVGPEGNGPVAVQAFVTAAQGVLGEDFHGALNGTVRNSLSRQCETSTSQGGAANNGNISFSFDMDNCPEAAEADDYTANESTSTSDSTTRCKGASRKVFNTSVKGSIAGKCGLLLDENGDYPRWEGIESSFESKRSAAKTTAENAYAGSYEGKNKIKSEAWSYAPYDAKGDYTVNYSDSPWADDCTDRVTDGCYSISTTSQAAKAYTKVIKTLTNVGWVQQSKGTNVPILTVTTNITSATTGTCADNHGEFLEKARTELNNNKPDCVVTDLTWTFQKEYQATTSITATSVGIDY